MASKIYIIDGTFRSTPSEFYQLVTIHMVLFDKTYPAIYLLLKNKNYENYKKALTFIKDKMNIISDFELGLSKAIENVFIQFKHYYCFFHYAQSLYRKILEFRYCKKYFENLDFNHLCKKFFSLSFFPIPRILCGLKILTWKYND